MIFTVAEFLCRYSLDTSATLDRAPSTDNFITFAMDSGSLWTYVNPSFKATITVFSRLGRETRSYLDICIWQVCPHKEFQKIVVISFEHLEKISNFPKLQECGSKKGPDTPISNLELNGL